MISIAICDDDKHIAVEIEELLLLFAKNNCFKINVEVYYNGSTLETAIDNGNEVSYNLRI